MSRRVQTRASDEQTAEAPARDDRRFALTVLGFPTMTVDEATERLADAFGLPDETARRYATEVPARVASELNVAQLDFHVLLLHELGAELRVVEETGEGRWTVMARRSLKGKIEPDVICRWRHAQSSPILRRGPRTEAGAGSPPPSEPDVPVGLSSDETLVDDLFDEVDEPGRVYQPPASPTRSGREPARAGDGDPDTPEFKVAVYAPPNLEREHATWVDQHQTAEFFIRGLRERQKRGWARKKAKPARTKTRLAKATASPDAETRLKRRERVAKVVLTLCLAVGAGLVIQALLPPGARELSHTSDVGRFTAELPAGFPDVESRTGVYASPLGQMGYSAYAVRKRRDPVGALAFNVLDVPNAIRARWSERQVVEGAIRAAVDAQEGQLVETRRVRHAGRDGIEARYRVSRFGHDYLGRVRVFDVEGDLALLLCEGVDTACQSDARANQFFDSFDVQLASAR